MESTGISERFSRQVILPGVGVDGQKKWEEASIALAGEGPALEAAQTALERVGLTRITRLTPKDSETIPAVSAVLVMTGDAGWRRQLNRHIRSKALAGLFAWGGETGFSLFLENSPEGSCPCLECFEAMNPKAFSNSKPRDLEKQGEEPSAQRLMGAMAATETLQWILKGKSPLEGKVWMTSFADGISIKHEVHPSLRCPARMAEEGAAVTP